MTGAAEKIEAIYPLSPLQRGLLFHSVYAPQSGVYFEQISFTLTGALDVGAFERAWRHVAARHPALRTIFVWKGQEKQHQVVLKSVELPWQHLDWRGLPPDEQKTRLEEFMSADRRRGFDLTRGPLMRFALARLAEDRHRLVWSAHHLLFDGWSLSIVLREVFDCYEHFSRGSEARLKPAAPYREYINWLQRRDPAGAEPFWRELLGGLRAPTPLGVDRATPPEGEGGYAEQEFGLTPEVSAALRAAARSHRVTLNALVQGAWALLLSCYSGEMDVTFGVVLSGRPPEMHGVETMVGLFINTLPVRVRMRPDDTVLSVVRRLQGVQAEMSEHEYSSLVEVQKWSEVPAGRPLFESIYVYESFPGLSKSGEDVGGLMLGEFSAVERTNYPLAVVVAPGEELSLRATYDRRRFDDETIKRLLGHMGRLLERMPAGMEERVCEVSPLTARERRRLLAEWNETRAEYPPDARVHRLVEEQARRSPESVAASDPSGSLTYAELELRSGALAARLSALGVGPESRVGVLSERRRTLPIALLGVLKAGAAYVPLDPRYPGERLRFMLSDSGAEALVCAGGVGVPEWWRGAALRLGEGGEVEGGGVEGEAGAAQGAGVRGGRAGAASADNAAYVIYTSGSTGRPKGVVVTHRGLTNYVANWCLRAYPVDKGRGAVVHSSIAFDLTLTGLLAPLLAGREVRLVPESEGVDGLGEVLMREGGFSLVKLTPAHLELLARRLTPQRAAGRTHSFVIGGEPLPAETVAFWQKHAPDTALFNEYGPTEAVVGCCVYEVPRGAAPRSRVPIGRPVVNARLYVLDRHLRLVPEGVAGELYVGGDGLARGYQNRPGLTAERFIPDPFSDEPGARLYRTGDLVRHEAGGELEFLGRLDEQVKIRGHRVEPGEVESLLREHPAVREAAVLARATAGGDLRLVAYVVPESEAGGLAAALKEHLKTALPDYMVPSAFVLIERLPLTSSGKLDRGALPEPDRARPESRSEYVAPRSGSEQTLAQIWAEVLELERVGVHDDFFELGGHSLLVMQVASRVYKSFRVDLPLSVFFDAPTVAEQIVRIALAQAGQAGGEEVARILAGLE